MKKGLTFEYEIPLWQQGYVVVGIDEVGRGALAGPLGVGAVAFEQSKIKDLHLAKASRDKQMSNVKLEISDIEKMGINDSKKLSAKKREECAEFIKQRAMFCSTVHMAARLINEKGISKAFDLAIQLLIDRCVKLFKDGKLFVLVDGNFNINIEKNKNTSIEPNFIKTRSVIGGDGKVFSIAAASIIAKVERDAYMKNLSSQFPHYGFDQHVGYGTAAHRAAIKQFGKCPEHRDLFIRKVLKG